MNDLLKIYMGAFAGMKANGPKRLTKRAVFEAEEHDLHSRLAEEPALLEAFASPPGDSALASLFRTQFALWDATTAKPWADATPINSPERRARALKLLEVSETLGKRLGELFPIADGSAGVVISEKFVPWYEASLEERPPFYWEHYQQYLIDKKWDAHAIANLGLNTGRVVERLADPEHEEAYQAKGLVVGYVQSGKTANFTGVIAKAIDAGYRLIIVLTGTTNLLREQTQRRLDKELVGKRNLIGTIQDEALLAKVDYYGEPDWEAFVDHGVLPSAQGMPDIRRLTTKNSEYRELRTGIESLDFQRRDKALPLNAAVNLRSAPVRLAVVKKNSTVLTNLIEDLQKITAELAEVPAILIDDESDQASVNTVNPDPSKRTKAQKAAQQERTAINRAISKLLGLLRRGQYIGYTATPFANVFADPSDGDDIFPRHFILSLERPPGYMGATDFHDLDDPDPEDRDVASSNELAFVRRFILDDDDDKRHLRTALDMYVLTGAIKRWRAERLPDLDLRHHTMLVHESVGQKEHAALSDTLREIWKSSSWTSKAGRERLRRLYEKDILPVMEKRVESGVPCPETFADLRDHILAAVHDIDGPEQKPVWIVNGDKDMAEPNIDFGSRPVWKILVGGTKLSRGFTIEGLTVSYYRRTARQMDTLMQMGRWFGFREGYRDLVRLYIDKPPANASSKHVDLYLGFEAACHAEEAFRDELKRYAILIDGVPQVTPKEIPPLVAQHLTWLRPAAANKMFNAELVERRSPGIPVEPTAYPRAKDAVADNATRMLALAAHAAATSQFLQPNGATFDALHGIISHEALLDSFKQLLWQPPSHFLPDLEWLRKLVPAQISDWVILIPQLKDSETFRDLDGLPSAVSIHARQRRTGRDVFGAISDSKHRQAPRLIALTSEPCTDLSVKALRSKNRGALLIYPVWESTPGSKVVPANLKVAQTIFAFRLYAPMSTASTDGSLVRFRARVPSKKHKAIVDVPAGTSPS